MRALTNLRTCLVWLASMALSLTAYWWWQGQHWAEWTWIAIALPAGPALYMILRVRQAIRARRLPKPSGAAPARILTDARR